MGSLPVPEGAQVQEPDVATPAKLPNAPDVAVATTLVATATAEVPEETTDLTATTEGADDAEVTIDTAPIEAAETASTTGICCGTLAAVQQLRASPTQTSACPEKMHSIDGAMYKDGDSNYQVCCNTDDRPASDFVDSVLSVCEDGTTQTPIDSNDIVGLQFSDSADDAPAQSADDAEAQEGPGVDADGTNSANAMKNAAIIGMTLLGAALQVTL